MQKNVLKKDIKKAKRIYKAIVNAHNKAISHYDNAIHVLSKYENIDSKQLEIVQHVVNGNNVIVDAVAGSGKTTTVLSIAKFASDKHIVQITYNKALQLEVEGKVKKYGIKNLKVFTYHAYAGHIYGRSCKDHTEMKEIIIDTAHHTRMPKCDVLIIDECQDMQPIMYQLICKILYNVYNNEVQLVLLGDKKQCVYGYTEADSRFLTLGSEIFERNFVALNMNRSYRITENIARFINNICLGYERIVSNKIGPAIKYTRLTNSKYISYDNLKLGSISIANEIVHFIQTNRYKASDIFILANYFKGMNNFILTTICNRLSEEGINIYTKSGDGYENERLIDDKVIASTIVSSKGRERKVVYALCDDGIYYHSDKEGNPIEVGNGNMPDLAYVALTRASEMLHIIAYNSNMRFFTQSEHDLAKLNYINFNGKPMSHMIKSVNIQKNLTPVTVTYLIKHVNEKIMWQITELIEPLYGSVFDNDHKLDIPNESYRAETKTYEDVSDINGTLLPLLYDVDVHCRRPNVIDSPSKIPAHIRNEIKSKLRGITSDLYFKFKNSDVVKKFIAESTLTTNVMQQWIMYVLAKKTLQDNFTYHLRQTETTWLKYENYTSVKHRFDKILAGRKWRSEHATSFIKERPYGYYFIHGFIDATSTDAIYEFKCTNSNSIEHKIQLLLYAYIVRNNDNCKLDTDESVVYKEGIVLNKNAVFTHWYEQRDRECKMNGDAYLYNFKCDYLWKLNYNAEVAEKIINLLLDAKYKPTSCINDEEFVDRCMTLKSAVTHNGVVDQNIYCEEDDINNIDDGDNDALQDLF